MKLKYTNTRALQITLGVLLLLIGFGVNNSLDDSISDNLLKVGSHKIPDSTKVIIVTIDNSSLDYVRKNTSYAYPWPRDFYAHIVDYLKAENSKAVLFDILFYDESRETSEAESGEYDKTFADAMRKHGNVYLATQLSTEAKEIGRSLTNYKTINKNIYNFHEYYSANMPIDTLYNAAKGVVSINVQSDKDGILREIPIYSILKENGSNFIIPSYPVTEVERHIKREDLFKVPQKQGSYHLNWYNEDFMYCPIKAVLQSAIAMKYGGEPTIPSGYFDNAVVMIGATADGLNDLKHTPLGVQKPGIEAWATLYTNLVTDDHIRFASSFVTVIIISLFLVLLVWLTNRDSFAKPLVLSLIITTLIVLIAYSVWISTRYILPIPQILVVYIIYMLSFTFLSFAKEYKERLKIRNMFSRYISREILKELEKNPNLIDLGGEEVRAAVMFSDVYNFTTLTEKTEPRKLVEILNKYFTVMGDRITGNNGLLEAYLGDGILAVFGVPIQAKQTSDYAYNACNMAIQHIQHNKDLKKKGNLELSDELHLNTRIGIATGKLIAGNIGSPSRMDYTVIGDTVNIASRLESINKYYRTNIIICEHIYDQVKDEFLFRKLDRIILKGKTKPLTIYELVDNKTIDSKNEYGWINDYEEALKLYFDSEFLKASEIFNRLYTSEINDKPSGIMLNRCRSLLENPPGEWEGIFTMEVK